MAPRRAVEYGYPVSRPPRLPLLGPRRRAINADLPAEREAAEEKASLPDEIAPRRRRRRLWPIAGAGVLLAAAVAGVLITTGVLEGDETPTEVAPLPVQTESVPEGRDTESAIAAARLGFPTFATKNTTRVGGASPVENAAAVALARFPSSGDSPNPVAVAIVPAESWPVALAASVLSAPPLSAPILMAESDGIGEVTSGALQALAPTGQAPAAGSQVLTVGAVPAPEGFATRAIEGETAAEIAAAIAGARRELTGEEPEAFVIISDTDPGFAMPAAAWAARSGDPILISGADTLPPATKAVLSENPGVPVYMLGPASLLSARVERLLGAGKRPVIRIEGTDPVSNAIEFARFSDGTFGWNITDPGHGLIVTSASEPLNAAAAAPLSAAGSWGPLLLTNDRSVVPGALRSYLLDIKPGYDDDPTRAVYNHIWLIGDQDLIGVGQQGTLDQLAELEQIQGQATEPEADTGETGSAPAPGQAGDNGAADENDDDGNE